jgi:hypothetical protein
MLRLLLSALYVALNCANAPSSLYAGDSASEETSGAPSHRTHCWPSTRALLNVFWFVAAECGRSSSLRIFPSRTPTDDPARTICTSKRPLQSSIQSIIGAPATALSKDAQTVMSENSIASRLGGMTYPSGRQNDICTGRSSWRDGLNSQRLSNVRYIGAHQRGIAKNGLWA